MNIQLDGFDNLDARLRKLGAVSVWAKPIMNRAILYVHSQVPSYPPPPEGSKYRRTGTLGRTITTEVRSLSGNDIAGFIGNKTVYAPDVISSEAVGDRGPQRRIHKRTGWYTLQGVVSTSAAQIKVIFETGIRALLG